MNNLGRILVFALALWLTTLIVGGPGDHGIWIEHVEDGLFGAIFTFVVVAIIFGAINLTIGRVLRFLSFPLRLLTLGFFSLVINAILLLIVGWVSSKIGFGLSVQSFGWALLGAIVLAITNMILNAVFRTKK